MLRLIPIAAILCLASCDAPAAHDESRNPFYLSSPDLQQRPSSGLPVVRPTLTPNQISPYGSPAMDNGMAPVGGTMSVGGGGG